MNNSDITTKFRAYLLTERCVAHNTYLSYNTDLAQFENFLSTQNVDFGALQPSHIQQFLAHLYALNTSTRSVARKLSTIKLLCEYIHRYCGLPDIRSKIHLPKLNKTLPEYLSLDEVDLLLKTAKMLSNKPNGMRNYVFVLLLYVSGMRISELASLTVDAIDYHGHALRIQGKGGKQRVIPLTTSIFKIISDYIAITRAAQLASLSPLTTMFLFPVFYKGRLVAISRQTCWVILKKIWQQTGSKRAIWPHQLRHSLATHMLARGVDLRSLQLLLGHENLATVQIYTHVNTSFLRALYDKKHPRS